MGLLENTFKLTKPQNQEVGLVLIFSFWADLVLLLIDGGEFSILKNSNINRHYRTRSEGIGKDWVCGFYFLGQKRNVL